MSDHSNDINTLSRFCAVRDVEALTGEALRRRFGFSKADLLVLFGGCVLAGADVLAGAVKEQVARRYMIVGGEGHTTQTLREKARALMPDLVTDSMPEAEIFDAFLRHRYGLQADLLEKRSTNCGNNITNMLEILDEKHITCSSIILVQDGAMQRRMAAGLEKYRPDLTAINFAAYQPEVEQRGNELVFREDILGMWDMDRFISLLMGEIPRLTDDRMGYGPAGRGFIAHVDVPEPVREAFLRLSKRYGIRQPDPAYA